MKVAIIGAGWAGLAAAVRLTQAGAHCSVFEAARRPGGRARTLAPEDDGLRLDNGQHILIGAYTRSLDVMRSVGVDPDQALLRLPLALRFADGSGLALPDCAPPWDALIGIARARGWHWHEKWALLRRAARWRLQGFACAHDTSVAQLCAGLPARLLQEFIEPLCVSALNTAAHEASASVFLRVLQDSLFSGHGGSNLLLPRTDLGACLADAASAWLQAQGAHWHSGVRVQALQAQGPQWQVQGQVQDQCYDAAIVATDSPSALRLLAPWAPAHWLAAAQALRHHPIATVYARMNIQSSKALLPAPMLALRAAPGAPAQFVFDKGQLGGPPGLLAFVVSTSEGSSAALQAQVLAQAQAQLGLQGLQPLQTVVEKRATFACTPGLERPGMALRPGLWAAGDYIDGPYPATLEGAVRSGEAAAQAVLSAFPGTTG